MTNPLIDALDKAREDHDERKRTGKPSPLRHLACGLGLHKWVCDVATYFDVSTTPGTWRITYVDHCESCHYANAPRTERGEFEEIKAERLGTFKLVDPEIEGKDATS